MQALVAVGGDPSGGDLFDFGVGIAEPPEHFAGVLAEPGRGEAKAISGCGRKGDRDRRCQHLAFGGVLDMLEESSLGEVGVGEQSFQIGDDTVGHVEMIQSLAPFGGGAPAHAL